MNRPAKILFAGGGTVEAWGFANTAGGSSLGRIFEKGDVVRMGRCEGGLGTASVFFAHDFTAGAGTWCSNVAVPLGTWFHLAVVYNRNSTANVPTMYVDGAAVGTTAVETPSGAVRADAGMSMAIGDRSAGGRAFDGIVDELRFANVERDAGWIATSYEDQRAPSEFVELQ